MTIATLAIAGIPPLAGFFSKDEILWQAYSVRMAAGCIWLIGVITAFITSFYMFRLLFLTFFGEYRGANRADCARHTSRITVMVTASRMRVPWVMLAPLVILAMLSVVGGWIGHSEPIRAFPRPGIPERGRRRKLAHEAAAETASTTGTGTRA